LQKKSSSSLCGKASCGEFDHVNNAEVKHLPGEIKDLTGYKVFHNMENYG